MNTSDALKFDTRVLNAITLAGGEFGKMSELLDGPEDVAAVNTGNAALAMAATGRQM